MPIAIPTTMDACHQVMLVKIFKFFVWWVAFIARSHLFRALEVIFFCFVLLAVNSELGAGS